MGLLNNAKTVVKISLKERVNETWASHIERLVKQGNILKLLAYECSELEKFVGENLKQWEIPLMRNTFSVVRKVLFIIY